MKYPCNHCLKEEQGVEYDQYWWCRSCSGEHGFLLAELNIPYHDYYKNNWSMPENKRKILLIPKHDNIVK